MAKDRGCTPRVAWFLGLIALVACGPRVQPDRPFPEEMVQHRERPPVPATSGRQVVIGELCPQGAAGRPAISPLVMRSTQWSDSASEIIGAIERGATPRFEAFGVDGKVAGVFDTLGIADLPLGQSVASGTYVGGAPCTSDAGQGQRTDEPKCLAATSGCGLAVAAITRPDDPPETPAFQTGGACVSGDALGVDIDGDGAVEWFPLADVLDGIRGPAAEWAASQAVKKPCAPSFELYDLKIPGAAEPGKQPDPKATVTLDLLGVIDLDGDGRKELVIALRFPTVRTIVVYSAGQSAERLELVGEAQAFQK